MRIPGWGPLRSSSSNVPSLKKHDANNIHTNQYMLVALCGHSWLGRAKAVSLCPRPRPGRYQKKGGCCRTVLVLCRMGKATLESTIWPSLPGNSQSKKMHLHTVYIYLHGSWPSSAKWSDSSGKKYALVSVLLEVGVRNFRGIEAIDYERDVCGRSIVWNMVV